MHRVIRTGRVAIVALVVVMVAAAGCSGGGESAAVQRSADRWANTVCTDLARWIAVAESASPSATADEALRLRSGIAGTEAPETDDGLAAQSEMEKLATAIEQEVRAADPGADRDDRDRSTRCGRRDPRAHPRLARSRRRSRTSAPAATCAADQSPRVPAGAPSGVTAAEPFVPLPVGGSGVARGVDHGPVTPLQLPAELVGDDERRSPDRTMKRTRKAYVERVDRHAERHGDHVVRTGQPEHRERGQRGDADPGAATDGPAAGRARGARDGRR